MPPDHRTAARSVFDAAAREYDAARPSYPAELFDQLEAFAGPLAGRLVLDWGAGTGISARQLAERGARVVLLDIGEQMLRFARAGDPRSPCVLADGNRMPLQAACADVTTFAQSWHWLAKPAALAEVARVLRRDGYWAAWWSRAAATGQDWFDRYEDVVTAACPGYTWRYLSDQLLAPDWTDGAVTSAGRLEPADPIVVPWTRHVTAAQWITDERSKSYLVEIGPAARESVLRQVAEIIAGRFPDGQMTVPYITTLLMARKSG